MISAIRVISGHISYSCAWVDKFLPEAWKEKYCVVE
jgi:hypothetical protein